MFEITGIDKLTLRTVDVAIASNPAELQKIREQEADKYLVLFVKKIRVGRR